MTVLFCGVFDLGGAHDPAEMVSQMAAVMAPDAGFDIARHGTGPMTIALLRRPQQPEIFTAGGDFLAADLDAASPYDRVAPADSISAPVLAGLFAEAPARALARLDGEFSAVHWNGQDGLLVLARDRLGTRPLFYVSAPGRWLAFASLPSALLVPKICDGRLNHEVVARLAIGNNVASEETEFQAIRRIMPGCYLEVTPTAVRSVRYWTLERGTPISHRSNPAEVFGELHDLLASAVRRRMPGTGQIAGHLSGGLDSSSVALLALEAMQSDQRFRGYAFTGPEPSPVPHFEDESKALAAIMASTDRVDLVEIPVEGLSALARGEVDTISGHIFSPTDGYWQVLADARAAGATRLLSGWGGDEGVSHPGWVALAEILRRGRIANAVGLARQASRQGRWPAWRMLAAAVRMHLLPAWLSGRDRRTLVRTSAAWQHYAGALRPHLRADAMVGEPMARPDVSWMRQQRLTFGHVQNIQEKLAYHAAQWGLSYVSPLLDREVCEFVLRLPPEFAIWGGRRRAPLREAMRGLLPDSVRLHPDKRLWDPAAQLRLVRARDALLARTLDLKETEAGEIFELDRIADEIRRMPNEDTFIGALKAGAKTGRKPAMRGFAFMPVLQTALFAGAATRKSGLNYPTEGP